MGIVLSVQAAITRYYRLGGLRNKHLFLMVLETGKSKIKVLADLVSEDTPPGSQKGKGILRGLQMAVFPLYPQMVGREKGAGSLSLLIRT